MINVHIQKGQDWQSASAEALAETEKVLAGSGRVILRASGTEPVVRVMVEDKKEETARKYAQLIADSIQQKLG